MTTLGSEELAARAGVDAGWIGRLADLGILRAADDGGFAIGNVHRARFVQGLEEAGIPLASIAEVLARGEFSLSTFDLPVYERFALYTETTFREVSAEQGIPLELLMVIREAVGLAQASPDDLVREDELRVVPLVRLQLARGFRPAVIERWLRVYGESLHRVADTETEWWRTEVQLPHLESGMSEPEMLELTNRWGEEMAALMEQALLAVYHAQQEHAWHENFVADVQGALERAGLSSGTTRPPAMCFLDITGYTRLTEERGDEAAAELAARLSRLVQRAVERHRGRVVRWLGDGVMLYFRDPGAAVQAALDAMTEITTSGLPPAHVGIDAGPVVFQGGDYFGRTVNIAARIAEYARPGELLVSEAVVVAADLDDVTLAEIGPVEVKGVSAPIRLYAVSRAGRV